MTALLDCSGMPRAQAWPAPVAAHGRWVQGRGAPSWFRGYRATASRGRRPIDRSSSLDRAAASPFNPFEAGEPLYRAGPKPLQEPLARLNLLTRQSRQRAKPRTLRPAAHCAARARRGACPSGDRHFSPAGETVARSTDTARTRCCNPSPNSSSSLRGLNHRTAVRLNMPCHGPFGRYAPDCVL
jgi:hypothetical protein